MNRQKSAFSGREPGQWNPKGGHDQSVNPYREQMEAEGCHGCGVHGWPMIAWELGRRMVIVCRECAGDAGSGLLKDSGRCAEMEGVAILGPVRVRR